ncbi:MAG: helix-turn-helix domain-containing protein [Culicoidibacterales bacterium]
MNFGEKVKQKRKVLNFDRTHMANTLGISVESYRRIEDGAMDEQLLIIKKIASSLGLNYTYLFSVNKSEFEHQRQKELR